MQHVLIETGDDLRIRACAVIHLSEFGRIDKTLCHIVQPGPAVQCLDPITQAILIRGAVECRLIDTVSLTGIAIDIEGQPFALGFDTLDVLPQIIAACIASIVHP